MTTLYSIRPDVSIIIPTHNCVEYLPNAIDSILSQNIANIEIIVVDDGSTDNTWEWLQNSFKNDLRVRSFHLDGKGVSYARNYAISQAKSEYIAFLDADDLWYKDKLGEQIEFHKDNPDVVFSFTDYDHYDMEGNFLGSCFDYWPYFSKIPHSNNTYTILNTVAAAALFAENVVGTSTVMAKKSILQLVGGFDETLKSASDWDLWIELSLSGPVGFTHKTGMNYLMRSGSITSNAKLRLDNMYSIISKYESRINRISPIAVARAYGRHAIGCAEHFALNKQYWRALLSHSKALYLAPSKRLAKAIAADIKCLIKAT